MRRANCKTNRNEVDLTEHNRCIQLKTIIENDAPVAASPQDIRFLDIIGETQKKQHTVLHEACSVFDSTSFSHAPNPNVYFKISFVEENGNALDNSKNMCLTGQCLDTVFGMSEGLKSRTTKRFVHDNTVFSSMKNNWTSRNQSQRSKFSHANNQHHKMHRVDLPRL